MDRLPVWRSQAPCVWPQPVNWLRAHNRWPKVANVPGPACGLWHGKEILVESTAWKNVVFAGCRSIFRGQRELSPRGAPNSFSCPYLLLKESPFFELDVSTWGVWRFVWAGVERFSKLDLHMFDRIIRKYLMDHQAFVRKDIKHYCYTKIRIVASSCEWYWTETTTTKEKTEHNLLLWENRMNVFLNKLYLMDTYYNQINKLM